MAIAEGFQEGTTVSLYLIPSCYLLAPKSSAHLPHSPTHLNINVFTFLISLSPPSDIEQIYNSDVMTPDNQSEFYQEYPNNEEEEDLLARLQQQQRGANE